MSFGKRQLILATLVVSLGAAVYLNWQFSGDGGIEAADASASDTELGTAQLVNGSPDVSSQPEETQEDTSTPAEDSAAASAPTDSEMETASGSEAAEEANAGAGEDYFTEARLTRQQTRDESLDLLNETLDNGNASTEEVQAAVEESAAIAKNLLNESNIESLIKAKGYTDCVAFIQGSDCSVVVGKPSEFTAEDAAIIKDIVVGQCDVPSSNVKIVDHVTS